MTLEQRLKAAAREVHGSEIQMLLLEAAQYVEQARFWKIKWAERDYAFTELQDRFTELRVKFEEYRKEHTGDGQGTTG